MRLSQDTHSNGRKPQVQIHCLQIQYTNTCGIFFLNFLTQKTGKSETFLSSRGDTEREKGSGRGCVGRNNKRACPPLKDHISCTCLQQQASRHCFNTENLTKDAEKAKKRKGDCGPFGPNLVSQKCTFKDIHSTVITTATHISGVSPS